MKPAPPVTRRRIVPAMLARACTPPRELHRGWRRRVRPGLCRASHVHHVTCTDRPRSRRALDNHMAGIVDTPRLADDLLSGQDNPDPPPDGRATPAHLVGQLTPPTRVVEQRPPDGQADQHL